jgi:hypothetical protein
MHAIALLPQAAQQWPSHAQLALRLCMRILDLACELTAKCSLREITSSLREQLATAGADGDDVEATACAADLHPASLLMPMLSHALKSLHSSRLGKWQKRVAFHAAQRIAIALSSSLEHPPTEPPPDLAGKAVSQVRLATGERVAFVADRSVRLSGAEGVTRLARVLVGGKRLACLFGVDQPEMRMDFCHQAVLPWKAPEPGAVSSVLRAAQRSFDTLNELMGLGTKIVLEVAPKTALDGSTATSKDEAVTAERRDLAAAAEKLVAELKRLQASTD